MNPKLILATTQGVVICEKTDGEWRPALHGLEGSSITCLAAQGGVILAGTPQGIYRSADGGQNWSSASRGLTIPHLRWLACDPQNAASYLAGTEPAGIFLSRDGGESWQGRPEVTRLRDQHRWSLPYSPEAGCVRGFALHGQRHYAAVEVGGVLVSDDGGESWQLAGSGRHGGRQVNPDVHSILVHPSAPDLVFAPTGGGFYRSQDGGQSWDLLYRCYCRAAWVDPDDTGHIILGPADSVDREGRIEETRDGGLTWQDASAGLATPWPRHMVERFHYAGMNQASEELFAVLSNGELLVTSLPRLSWKRILPHLPRVSAVTTY